MACPLLQDIDLSGARRPARTTRFPGRALAISRGRQEAGAGDERTGATIGAVAPPLSSELMRSRLAPPRLRVPLVEREDLLQRLVELPPGSVLALCAPPGGGKTVLLSQWAQRHRAAGLPAAWLTLDEGDDLDTLAAHLAGALHAAGLETRAGPRPPMGGARMRALLAALEASDRRWLLVLDDADRVSAAVLDRLLSPLLRFPPPGLTVALATRTPGLPDLHLASARGWLTVIGAEQLRFSAAEVAALLGPDAAAAEAAGVAERSSGWPVLVQWLARAARGDCAAAEQEASGFLDRQVIQRLDPLDRDAVYRLSLLQRLDATLAQAALPGVDAEATLARLRWQGVLCPAGGEAVLRWQIHPLLRPAAVRALEGLGRDEADAVRRTLADACLAAGHRVDAVRLAVPLRDAGAAADVVEACELFALWAREGLPRLIEILRLVPEAIVAARPRIALAAVVCDIKAGRVRQAQERFESLGSPRAGDVPFAAEHALCKALLASYRGEPLTPDALAAVASSGPGHVGFDAVREAVTAGLRTFTLAQASHFAEARAQAMAALRQAEDLESRHSAFFAYCDLGMVCAIEGDVTAALGWFDTCDRVCHALLRDDERLGLIRDALRLEVEHELDPHDLRALPRLKNLCLRLPRLDGWLDVHAAALRTCSEKLLLAGDAQAALAVLAVAVDALDEQGLAGVVRLLRLQRLLLLVAAGQAGVAASEWQGLEAGPPDGGPRPWRETELRAEVEASLQAAAGGTAVPAALEAAIEQATAAGNARSELRLRALRRALQAAADAGRHDDEARLEWLQQRTGFRRGFVPLSGQRAAADAPQPPDNAFFTQREQAVFELLTAGHADKTIARRLGISPDGVRFHLKRIYAKLGVTRRTQVRDKAARLGLLREGRPAAEAAP
jgi:LuxR family maltose regulon positive regulatory protein